MVESRQPINKFIRKATIVHGHKYDYSMVNYKNSYTPVKIICRDHGEFWQLPQHHLRGSNCPKCARIKGNRKKLIDVNKYIRLASVIHHNKYDYSLVQYNGCHNKIKIICPYHGVFRQAANDHLKGHGCPQCGRRNSDLCKKLTREEFIAKAAVIHNNKYDYSFVKYVDTITEVDLVCPKHGVFRQKPKNHIQGHGCNKCFTEISDGHAQIIDFVLNHGFNVITNDRALINPYELDIVIPSLKVAIEFNGNYWHSYNRPETTQEKYMHQRKHLLCKDKGIRLIQIFEYEWVNKRLIIESMLKHCFGKSNKINARDCDVINIDHAVSKEFFDNNHVYGFGKNASVVIGLKYNDQIMSMMSFNKINNGWEINRFANIINTTVIGGASKLIEYFKKQVNPSNIITYADARFGIGNVYVHSGFKLCGITKPNYKYVKGREIFTRQQFQKCKLINKLANFNPSLSESQNMFNNGYRRIWDAGHYKYTWENKNGYNWS